MSLIKWTPMMPDFMDDFDSMMDWQGWGKGGGFVPAVDVWQDDQNVYVECPLAGIDPKDVDVSVENDVLSIQGKTEKKSEVDEKEYYRKEVRRGSFHRSVPLPAAVDSAKVKAEFKNGVLNVVLPKEEKVKPKKIDIAVK